VFDACIRVLSDSAAEERPKRLHVVAAPVGAGKTTFSVAFAAASCVVNRPSRLTGRLSEAVSKLDSRSALTGWRPYWWC
jgi:hypothetical protein